MNKFQEGPELVCKPTDGRRRISFARADDFVVERSPADVKEITLNDTVEEDEIENGTEAPKPSHSSRKTGDRRPSTDDEFVASSEMNKLFDEVASKRGKSLVDIVLADAEMNQFKELGEPKNKPRRSRKLKSDTLIEMMQNTVFAVLMLGLVGAVAWSIISSDPRRPVVNTDDSQTTGTATSTPVTSLTTSSQDGDNLAQLITSTESPRPVTTTEIAAGNPGEDIGEYFIGFVEQPVKAEEIQFLLDHNLTKDIQVVCDDPRLDKSDAKTVSVSPYKVECGVKVDKVPLTLVCKNDELCGVYFVGSAYCDLWM